MKPVPNTLTNEEKLETNKDANMEINEIETRNVEITRKVNNLDCKKIKTFDKIENSLLSDTCTNRDFFLREKLNKIKL